MIGFEEVGRKAGLDSQTLKRFVYYMKARFAEREEEICRSGYGTEWAVRFLHKIEFECSDSFGRALLSKMVEGGNGSILSDSFVESANETEDVEDENR